MLYRVLLQYRLINFSKSNSFKILKKSNCIQNTIVACNLYPHFWSAIEGLLKIRNRSYFSFDFDNISAFIHTNINNPVRLISLLDNCGNLAILLKPPLKLNFF